MGAVALSRPRLETLINSWSTRAMRQGARLARVRARTRVLGGTRVETMMSV